MYFHFLPSFRSKSIRIPATDLILREPSRGDERQWIALRQQSAAFLQEWEPKWPYDDLTSAGYLRRLRSYGRQRQENSGYVYFLINEAENVLMGGLSLTRMKNNPKSSAVLGYWMGAPFAGQGHMSKAVASAIDHAFSAFSLGQVEAACLPRNKRSIALLEKLGFQQYGYSKDHLEINGVLEDHLLFSRRKTVAVANTRNTIENAGQSVIPMV